VEVHPSPAAPTGPWRLAVDSEPVDRHDELLFHKTTRRERYDEARARFPDADDVVLHNDLGEVTETTVANLVVARDGRLVTPPVRCGLLAGTFRAELVASGRVVEEVVALDELARAEALWAVNSVRGWVPCLAPDLSGDRVPSPRRGHASPRG
jgi:para-aminobenzoate synthetase / 4-amino-4-deoxychorismate lyase